MRWERKENSNIGAIDVMNLTSLYASHACETCGATGERRWHHQDMSPPHLESAGIDYKNVIK